MNTILETTTAGAKSTPETTPKALRIQKLSKDGKWKSFPKVPNLMQYVNTGTYFAKCKVGVNKVRASLETDVFTTAKLRLPDKLEELRKPKVELGTFADARQKYETALRADHTLKPASVRYRETRIAALLKSWPGLDGLKLDKITVEQCQNWATGFSAKWDEQNFNNTLGSLRAILETGGIGRDANPAYKVKRLGVKPTELQLPEAEQFAKMLVEIETSGAGQQQQCADLVRFLAYSGCRISEARLVTWGDVDLERGEMRVHNAKRSRTSNAAATRTVPIIPPMRQLLERLRLSNPLPTDRVCELAECEISLRRACKRVGIPNLTHHDLRHLFASVCIESGIDIPTVSRWLGHVDGGALAMKVYGHLRREHSAAMAAKVTFGAPALPPNAIPMPQEKVA